MTQTKTKTNYPTKQQLKFCLELPFTTTILYASETYEKFDQTLVDTHNMPIV